MAKVCPTCQREFSAEVDYCPHDGMKLRARRKEGDDPMIGRVLDGRWVIESRIGQGGMGAVYLGHQQSVDRKVAVKTLRASLADTEDFVDRFFQESRVATTVNHPHCVTIHDFGQEEDGTLYLAMEYLDGQPLTDRAKDGSLTIEEILHVGMQIASALSAAHDANIVHRDLKPDNIFLLDIPGGGTFVKVLDFGIAKVLGADTQMTRTGQVFGTPSYMSPEQCQGHPLDGRSDLYSLGCILYELVGGRPPFTGETPMAVLMAHIVQEVPPLRELGRGALLPPQMEAEIMALLAKDPDGRPRDAADARIRLESALAAISPGQLRHTASDLAVIAAADDAAPSTNSPDAESDFAPRSEPRSTAEFAEEAGIAPKKFARPLLLGAILTLVTLLAAAAVLFSTILADDIEDPTITAQDEAETTEAATSLAAEPGLNDAAPQAATSHEQEDQEDSLPEPEPEPEPEEAQPEEKIAEDKPADSPPRQARPPQRRREPAPTRPDPEPVRQPTPTAPPQPQERDDVVDHGSLQEEPPEDDPLDFFSDD